MNIERSTTQRIERILDVVVIVAAIATIPLTIVQVRHGNSQQTTEANWAIWVVFFVEFVVVLSLAGPGGWRSRKHLFNLIVVVLSFPLLPGVLEAVRLTRLARLARLVRLLSVLGRGARAFRLIFRRRGLLLVMVVTLAALFIGGGIMAELEPATVKGGYWSGVWWAIVTLTTVGYGDISPTTPLGRLGAGLLMLVGIGLISTLAAAVAAYFVGQDEAPELRLIEQRLDRIETLLVQLTTRQQGADTVVPSDRTDHVD